MTLLIRALHLPAGSELRLTLTHLLLLIMDSNTGNVLTELMQAHQTLKMWEGKTLKARWLLNVESGALQRDRVPGLPRPSSHTRTSSICPASPLRNVTERKMDAVTCLHHFHLSLKYRLDAVRRSWKGNTSLEKDKRITKTLACVCDYVRLSVCGVFFWKSGHICFAPVFSSLSRTTNLVLRKGRINLKYIL